MKMINSLRYFLVYLIQIVSGERKDMEVFVVGGEYTNINQHPHAAYIEGHCGGTWMCGSSVLNQEILITAAHCLEKCVLGKSTRHSIMALFGHEILDKVKVVRSADNFLTHKYYNEKTIVNDIALIHLKKRVPFGKTVKRIIIARTLPESGRQGIIAGWGHTGETLNKNLLKHVRQRVQSMKTCRKVGDLHMGMFCAGDTKESYPASGDSGSGLVTLLSYNLIGLVSFSNPNYKHLIVYTNVTYYIKWIKRNSKTLYCQG